MLNVGRHLAAHVRHGDCTQAEADQIKAKARALFESRRGEMPARPKAAPKPKAPKKPKPEMPVRHPGESRKARKEVARMPGVERAALKVQAASKQHREMEAELAKLSRRVKRGGAKFDEAVVEMLHAVLDERKQAKEKAKADQDRITSLERQVKSLTASLDESQHVAETADQRVRAAQEGEREAQKQLEPVGRKLALAEGTISRLKAELKEVTERCPEEVELTSSNRHRMPRDMQKILSVAQAKGWRLVKKGSGHLELQPKPIGISHSPSDVNQVRKVMGLIRQLDITRYAG